MVNDATRLLGLEGVAVRTVLDGPDDRPVIVLDTADQSARICLDCGMRASRSKGWVTTAPRDLPVSGRHPHLEWRKRRWCCDEPVCPRGSFTEQVAQNPARARLTGRLREAAGAAVADAGRTVVQSARDHGVSWPVVMAAFTAHAERVLPARPDPVRVLGIDEIRRGRARWEFDDALGTWRTDADRWHVGFVDLTGGQGLLGQVEGRIAAAVTAWLNACGPGGSSRSSSSRSTCA